MVRQQGLDGGDAKTKVPGREKLSRKQKEHWLELVCSTKSRAGEERGENRSWYRFNPAGRSVLYAVELRSLNYPSTVDASPFFVDALLQTAAWPDEIA